MRSIRISIFVATTLLIAVGVTMIYSSSAIYANENMGDSLFFLKKHLMFLAIGLMAALFFMSVDYNFLKKTSRPTILCCIALLVLVLIPSLGTQLGGARRWFRVWNLSFQPSEMAKLGLVIYLSDFLSRKAPYINDMRRTLLPLFMVCGTVMGLILLQPDLGTAIVVAATVTILLFLAGIKRSYLAALLGLCVPAFFFLVFLVPYRWKRIIVFLHPWQDPKGTGFQMVQSFLALGSGGLLGAGLGMSKQKLFYLPEAHTDFIFSIIGEELGLVGTLFIVILFTILIWEGMRVAFKAPDSFGRYLSLGIVTMIALEAMINIGVTIGAIPTKGLPLPFISYGGSALVFHMAEIGILLNVARDNRRQVLI